MPNGRLPLPESATKRLRIKFLPAWNSEGLPSGWSLSVRGLTLGLMKATKTRWVLALLCAGVTAKLVHDAVGMEGLAAFGRMIGGLLGMITTVLLISPETVFKVAEWCARLFVGMIWPSAQLEKPPLNYRLARYYTRSQRLEEAVAEYQKIIHFYPKERNAYQELIAVAIQLGDEELRVKYAALLREQLGE